MFQVGGFCGAEIRSLQVLHYPSLPGGARTWPLLFTYLLVAFQLGAGIVRYLKARGPARVGSDGPSQPLPSPEQRLFFFFSFFPRPPSGLVWSPVVHPRQTSPPVPGAANHRGVYWCLSSLPSPWGFLWVAKSRHLRWVFLCQNHPPEHPGVSQRTREGSAAASLPCAHPDLVAWGAGGSPVGYCCYRRCLSFVSCI